MKLEYACVHVIKDVEEDHFDKGCIGKRSTVMAERVDIVADSLPDLLKAIAERFGLTLDYLSIDGNRVSVNRLENASGYAPSASQETRWKAGQLRMYLADYSFIVERRLVDSAIPREDWNSVDIQQDHFEEWIPNPGDSLSS